MAAAVIADSFTDTWPSEEQIISENGILMGKEKLEELIINVRIRRIQKIIIEQTPTWCVRA